MAHGDLCPAELGWDAASGALAARIVAGYAASHDAAREAAWIAEADGRRAGCVSCVAADEATAQLRILLVEPPARGPSAAGWPANATVARQAGYAPMKLWTSHPVAAAGRVYQSRWIVRVAR
jgi:hypothetical protein